MRSQRCSILRLDFSKLWLYNEKIYLYHGYIGQFVGQDFDSEENIQIHRFTYEDINKMIEDPAKSWMLRPFVLCIT